MRTRRRRDSSKAKITAWSNLGLRWSIGPVFNVFLWPIFMFSGNWINYLEPAKHQLTWYSTKSSLTMWYLQAKVSGAVPSCLCLWKAICWAPHLHHEIGEVGASQGDKMKHQRIWQLQCLFHPVRYMNSCIKVPLEWKVIMGDENPPLRESFKSTPHTSLKHINAPVNVSEKEKIVSHQKRGMDGCKNGSVSGFSAPV